MSRILLAVLTLNAACACGGCTTWVDVKKINPDSSASGFRYSLPATFLLVQPQADGSASYSWVYLPDSDSTYAINQHAFLAKLTLDVTLSNGLLSKVNAQTDSSGVATKLLDAAQSTFAAREQAVATRRKDANAAFDGAKTAYANAKLAYDQAQQESQAINAPSSGYSDDDKRAAALKLIDAKAALDLAQSNLATATTRADGAADKPDGAPQQWGPVLFRVKTDTEGHVHLVAVNKQERFDTINVSTTAVQQPSSYTLSLATAGPVPRNKPLAMNILISVPVDSIDPGTTTTVGPDGRPLTSKPTLALSQDKKTLSVTFPDGLDKGEYSLTPALVMSPGKSPIATQTIKFTVQ